MADNDKSKEAKERGQGDGEEGRHKKKRHHDEKGERRSRDNLKSDHKERKAEGNGDEEERKKHRKHRDKTDVALLEGDDGAEKKERKERKKHRERGGKDETKEQDRDGDKDKNRDRERDRERRKRKHREKRKERDQKESGNDGNVDERERTRSKDKPKEKSKDRTKTKSDDNSKKPTRSATRNEDELEASATAAEDGDGKKQTNTRPLKQRSSSSSLKKSEKRSDKPSFHMNSQPLKATTLSNGQSSSSVELMPTKSSVVNRTPIPGQNRSNDAVSSSVTRPTPTPATLSLLPVKATNGEKTKSARHRELVNQLTTWAVQRDKQRNQQETLGGQQQQKPPAKFANRISRAFTRNPQTQQQQKGATVTRPGASSSVATNAQGSSTDGILQRIAKIEALKPVPKTRPLLEGDKPSKLNLENIHKVKMTKGALTPKTSRTMRNMELRRAMSTGRLRTVDEVCNLLDSSNYDTFSGFLMFLKSNAAPEAAGRASGAQAVLFILHRSHAGHICVRVYCANLLKSLFFNKKKLNAFPLLYTTYFFFSLFSSGDRFSVCTVSSIGW
jgi:hypothetical protein